MEALLKEFEEADSKFKAISERLRVEGNKQFPYHSVAHDGSQYVIITHGDCPSDQAACIFCNGNIWWRKLSKLTREDDKTKWPRWVRDYLLRKLPGNRERDRIAERERAKKEREETEKWLEAEAAACRE